jgi:hypothetical protein
MASCMRADDSVETFNSYGKENRSPIQNGKRKTHPDSSQDVIAVDESDLSSVESSPKKAPVAKKQGAKQHYKYFFW